MDSCTQDIRINKLEGCQKNNVIDIAINKNKTKNIYGLLSNSAGILGLLIINVIT